MPGPTSAAAAVTHAGYGTVAECLVYGVSVVSPAEPRGRPAAPCPSRLPGRSVRLLCRALPACEHRRRPGQGADIGDGVAVDDEQVGVIPGPQPTLPIPEAARGIPGADPVGRTTPTRGMPVGEELEFHLEPTSPPPWSQQPIENWRKERGGMVRLQLECHCEMWECGSSQARSKSPSLLQERPPEALQRSRSQANVVAGERTGCTGTSTPTVQARSELASRPEPRAGSLVRCRHGRAARGGVAYLLLIPDRRRLRVHVAALGHGSVRS
jgi:hypothetical protein